MQSHMQGDVSEVKDFNIVQGIYISHQSLFRLVLTPTILK